MIDKSEKLTIQTQYVIQSLKAAKPTITKLKVLGKSYEPLIEELLTFTEEYSLGAKELQKKLNIQPEKLRKWLQELYKDFTEFINSEDNAVSLQSTRVCFSVEGEDGKWAFYCQLAFIPRVGESISFPFLYAIVGVNKIYVQEVTYSYENGCTMVLVIANSTNPYINSLKKRALFEKKLDYRQASKMSKYELEAFLRDKYNNMNSF